MKLLLIIAAALAVSASANLRGFEDRQLAPQASAPITGAGIKAGDWYKFGNLPSADTGLAGSPIVPTCTGDACAASTNAKPTSCTTNGGGCKTIALECSGVNNYIKEVKLLSAGTVTSVCAVTCSVADSLKYYVNGGSPISAGTWTAPELVSLSQGCTATGAPVKTITSLNNNGFKAVNSAPATASPYEVQALVFGYYDGGFSKIYGTGYTANFAAVKVQEGNAPYLHNLPVIPSTYNGNNEIGYCYNPTAGAIEKVGGLAFTLSSTTASSRTIVGFASKCSNSQ